MDTMATKQFKAESKRLLDLMINSIYTHKEIFLRELISNAVDATQKLKTLSSIGEAKGDLGDVTIRVAADKEKKTLTVTDRGVGMTAEEVDNKLHSIMRNIHEACVKYGTEPDGYINYVKGANIAGFMKVANAMLAQGCV